MNLQPATRSIRMPKADTFELSCLFDNDRFVVVHITYAQRRRGNPLAHTFEVVDKATSESVHLTGTASTAFQKRIKDWQKTTPHEEQVEETIESFMAFGRLPLVSH